MKHSFTRYLAAAVLTAGATFAQSAPAQPANPAQPGHPAFRAMRARRLARMAQFLSLTNAQKEQAKAAFQQARQQAQPIRTQLQQNRQALADAVKAGKSDTEIQSLANTTGTLMGQLVAIRTGAFAKVYATLTPDQKAKADQWREQMRNRFQQRSGGQRSNG